MNSIARKNVGPYRMPSLMFTYFFSFFISFICSSVRPIKSLPESVISFSFMSSARTSPSFSLDTGILFLKAVLSRTTAKRYMSTKAAAIGKKKMSWMIMSSGIMFIFMLWLRISVTAIRPAVSSVSIKVIFFAFFVISLKKFGKTSLCFRARMSEYITE